MLKSTRDEVILEQLLREIELKQREYPDLRLGQLIINAMPPGTDLYAVDNSRLLSILRNYDPEGTHHSVLKSDGA